MKKSIYTKTLALTATFALAAAALSTSAFAAGTSSTITGGELTGGGLGFNPLSITLDGTQQSSDVAWSIAGITDARGTGTGWNLGLALTPFQEVNDLNEYVTDGKTLASSSLKVLTSPSVSQVDTTSSLASTIAPVNVATALDTGSEVRLLSATTDGGMGSYTFGDMGVELTVPANAYAKTYKTTATVTLHEAP